ncbi:MAG: 5-formyltetrahydrofolate cyclo-ligase [Planctomycetes bacterium]|nr:5-formyltetrahydrofolate cyclo-ligase [Planctomycetota bacterium]
MDKAQLRKDLRQILARMPEEIRRQKSRQICGHLLDAGDYKKASVVMAFLSMPGEVDTTPILLDAWQRGKTVVVPKVLWEQRRMIPVEIRSLDTGLGVDKMGLRNPTTGEPVPYDDIDLVITPGLGFDRQGNRLGRGGAYYDRFFVSPGLRAMKWAVAFSEQIVDAIPCDSGDIPIEAIVCETGIIRCG